MRADERHNHVEPNGGAIKLMRADGRYRRDTLMVMKADVPRVGDSRRDNSVLTPSRGRSGIGIGEVPERTAT